MNAQVLVHPSAPISLRRFATPERPLQIALLYQLELPSDRVFDLLAFHIPEWFGQVREVRWDHRHSVNGRDTAGASSRRSCQIGGKVLEEEIVEFIPGRMYAYQADLNRSTLKMPIRNHLGVFAVTPAGSVSRVEWRQHYLPPFWPLSSMVRWQMRDKMMLPAVRGLIEKYGGEILSTRPDTEEGPPTAGE